MGISTLKLTIVAAILFQAVVSNEISIQVPEVVHKEFQTSWYDVANKYAQEHYKENTVIKNEEFYNFTAKIDGLMQKKILNVTNVDITDTTADTTKILGELYRDGNVTGEQLTAIVNYGQRLQHPYIQKVIELYELKPSHFNSTEEIFCDVFVCPTTTTVTEKVTTPTSTPTTITTSTTIPTTETTVPTTETTVSTTTNIPTTTVLIPLIDERDLVGSESSQTTTDVSDDQVATIAMLFNDSEPVTTSTSTTTTMSTTATDASTTTTISTTGATAIPTPVPVSSAPSSAVPNTFLVVMSINFIMNCLLHF